MFGIEITNFASRWSGTCPFADECVAILLDLPTNDSALFRLCDLASGGLGTSAILIPLSEACRIACSFVPMVEPKAPEGFSAAKTLETAISAIDDRPTKDDGEWEIRQTAAFYVASLAAECSSRTEATTALIQSAYRAARSSDTCASARMAISKCLRNCPSSASTMSDCSREFEYDDPGRDAALFAMAYSAEPECVTEWLPRVISRSLTSDWRSLPHGCDALVSSVASAAGSVNRCSRSIAVVCSVAAVIGESSPWGCGFDPVRGPTCASSAVLLFDSLSRMDCGGTASAIRRTALVEAAIGAFSVASDSLFATRRKSDLHRGAACAARLAKCASRAFDIDLRSKKNSEGSVDVVARKDEDSDYVGRIRSCVSTVNCCGSAEWLVTQSIAREKNSRDGVEILIGVRALELQTRSSESRRKGDSIAEEAWEFALSLADVLSDALSDGGWPIRGGSRSDHLPCRSSYLETHDHELRISGPAGLSAFSMLVGAAIGCALAAASYGKDRSADFASRLFGTEHKIMFESATSVMVASVSSALDKTRVEDLGSPVTLEVSRRMLEACCSLCSWTSIACISGVNRYVAEDLGKRLDAGAITVSTSAYPKKLADVPKPTTSLFGSALRFAAGVFSKVGGETKESGPLDARKIAEARVTELFGGAGRASDAIVCRNKQSDRQLVRFAEFYSDIAADIATGAVRSVSRDPLRIRSLETLTSKVSTDKIETAAILAMSHAISGWPNPDGTRTSISEREEECLRKLYESLSDEILRDMAEAASVATLARSAVRAEAVPLFVDPFGLAKAGTAKMSGAFAARWSIRAISEAASCGCNSSHLSREEVADSVALAVLRCIPAVMTEDPMEDLIAACSAMSALGASRFAAIGGISASCIALSDVSRSVRLALETDDYRHAERVRRCSECCEFLRSFLLRTRLSKDIDWMVLDAIEKCCHMVSSVLSLALWYDSRTGARTSSYGHVLAGGAEAIVMLVVSCGEIEKFVQTAMTSEAATAFGLDKMSNVFGSLNSVLTEWNLRVLEVIPSAKSHMLLEQERRLLGISQNILVSMGNSVREIDADSQFTNMLAGAMIIVQNSLKILDSIAIQSV